MIRLELQEPRGIAAGPVDPDRTFIEAIVLAEDPSTFYCDLHVECSELRFPPSPDDADDVGFVDECTMELTGLSFGNANWRELAGRSCEVSFAPADVHPILPDNPGNVYFESRHHVPDDNVVRLGARVGASFELTWTAVARARPDDPGIALSVTTRIPLRRFQVYFDDPSTLDPVAARDLALRFARSGDLGEPIVRAPRWVVIPLLPIDA